MWQLSSSATTPTKSPLIVTQASSSTPTVDKQEDEEEEEESTSFTDDSQPINSIPLGGCKSCGKAEIERGCNGEGRIQGGIATVPGFGWWPLKLTGLALVWSPPVVGIAAKARAWMRLPVLVASQEPPPLPPPPPTW